MTLFTDLAPRIMKDLMAEFSLTMLDAAAIVGNLGHESGGFKFLQEIKPVVKGSRGGYGWAQWTASRRVSFEKFCKDNGYSVNSYEGNYNYLVWELKNTERKAIPNVKKADTLFNKVKAFELAFERAGVKHYDSRNEWALKAMRAYEALPSALDNTPDPVPFDPDLDAGIVDAIDITPWWVKLIRFLLGKGWTS